MKKQKTKTLITTVILVLALSQGPFLFYFTSGFFKLVALLPLAIIGLGFTIYLLISVFKFPATNTRYHIIGLILSFLIGFFTIKTDALEYMDWNFRKGERNKIVNEIKRGALKPDSLHKTGTCHLSTFLPISNNGNDIDIDENTKGIVSVKFYIDRGFLDHFSAFVYTNDPDEVNSFNSGVGPFGTGAVEKLDANWYRVSY